MTRAFSAALLCALLAACASSRVEEEVIQDAKDKVFPAVVFIKPIQKEFRGGKMEKVQVFGSGHSRMMVEEMWPRYGSFPGFNPMVELSLSGARSWMQDPESPTWSIASRTPWRSLTSS